MNRDLPLVIKFNGFRAGTHARAIHEYLRASNMPRTFGEITNATAVINGASTSSQNAMKHLRYWEKRSVYIETSRGWILNPRGVRFEPREFAG